MSVGTRWQGKEPPGVGSFVPSCPESTPSDPPTGPGHFVTRAKPLCDQGHCLTLLSCLSYIGLHGGAVQGFDVTPELEDGELLSRACLVPGQLLAQGILQELDAHCGRQGCRSQGVEGPGSLEGRVPHPWCTSRKSLSNLGPFVLNHVPLLFLPSAQLSVSVWADLAFPKVPSLGI